MQRKVQLNLEMPLEVREEFRIAATLKGLTMSGVLNEYIRRVIREEKQHAPELFERLLSRERGKAAA